MMWHLRSFRICETNRAITKRGCGQCFFCLDPTYWHAIYASGISESMFVYIVCMYETGWNITQNSPPAERFQKVCVSLDQATDCALLRPRWWKWKVRGRPVQARVGQWIPPRPWPAGLFWIPLGFFHFKNSSSRYCITLERIVYFVYKTDQTSFKDGAYPDNPSNIKGHIVDISLLRLLGIKSTHSGKIHVWTAAVQWPS